KRRINGQKVVILPAGKGTFSFLGTLYVSPEEIEDRMVWDHERAHMRQRHSLDILLLEILRIGLWFYPVWHNYRRHMRLNHEFLADAATTKNHDSYTYSKLLLKLAVAQQPGSPAHPFRGPALPRRIHMLNSQPSHPMTKLKYFFALPIMALLVPAFSIVPIAEDEPHQPTVHIKSHAPTATPQPPSGVPFAKGTDYGVSSGFGMRKNPLNGKHKHHTGIDFKAAPGTPIIAPADGTVLEPNRSEAWGIHIVLHHDAAYTTAYAHLQKSDVKAGDKVRKGEVIGYVGNTGRSTGPHLHYEVLKDGEAVDPATYLGLE
ncbi:MAG: peptidoglycan DD-metalloendopeptidase family protein, partial [Bacteroidota bacterium]